MSQFLIQFAMLAFLFLPIASGSDVTFEKAHEVRANSFSASTQSAPAIAPTNDGGFVVAWHSRRQQAGTYGIYLQRFAADGHAVGTETQVNIYTKSMQMNPAIAADSAGGVWVAWESFGQDGSFNGIIARKFAGNDFEGGDEILVNRHTGGNQSQVVIAGHDDESATFFWVTQDNDGTKRHIAARRFDAKGIPVSDEFIPAPSRHHQSNPSVAVKDDQMVLVWAELDKFGRPANLFGRQISSQRHTLNKIFEVNPTDQAHHLEPTVTVNHDGHFFVAWLRSHDQEYEVYTRTFDQQSDPLSGPVRVSLDGAKYVSGAVVEALNDDQVLVCWNQQTDAFGKDRNIFGRIVDARETTLSPVLPINKNREGHHLLPSASGKRLVQYDQKLNQLRVVWAGTCESDNSSVNVTAFVPGDQRFAFSKPVEAKTMPSVEMTAKPHEPPTFDPLLVAKEPFGGFETLGPDGATDFGFVAINATGWNPPDPVIAVGPGHLVAMTNGAIAFFDKAGNLTFNDQIEGAAGFWGNEGATELVFDPETLFDPHSQRFFAMASERDGDQSFFLLAVSDDDDPNGSWFRYRLNVTSIADRRIDSPNMAVDQDVVYLTADFFGPDRYLVFMLRKSDLLVGAQPQTTNLLINGSQSYGLPLIYDTDAPAFYMLQAFEFGNFNQVRLHGITDALTNPQRVTTDLAVPSYGNPVDPPQMGTTVRPELFEARFWSCVYRDGSLWAVHHHSPGSTQTVRARWYEFAINGWPTSGQQPQLVQMGELTPLNDGGQLSATFFPSIWVDADGNAAITTARSSMTEFISMSRAVRAADDPTGTFQEVQLVQPSTTFFTTNGRWGDYSGTNSDPVEPGAFWGISEFAQSNGVWQTYIAKFFAEVLPISVFPTSTEVNIGTTLSGSGFDLADSDDNYLTLLAEPATAKSNDEVVIVVSGNATETEFETLNFSVESRVNTPNVTQIVELFNFQTNTFEEIDRRATALDDDFVEIEFGSDASRFITPASGTLLARIRFKSTGPTLFFPWVVRLDQVQWQLSQ